jgi:hypothetical protein
VDCACNAVVYQQCSELSASLDISHIDVSFICAAIWNEQGTDVLTDFLCK